MFPTAAQLRLDLREIYSPRFSGKVRFSLKIEAETSNIVLHGDGLVVSYARIFQEGGEQRAVVSLHQAAQRIQLAFAAPLKPGSASLELGFFGRYGKDTGLFRRDGNVFSQFQPTHARSVFPSFDEPRFKIPWELMVVVDQSKQAFGNAPVARENEMPDGNKEVVFQPTAALPAYLVALAVGTFETIRLPDSPASGARSRLIGRPGAVSEVASVLSLSYPEILHYYETYLAFRQPYPKLDFILVPDLPHWGMEHPGLLFFRETSSVSRGLVAHELAHLWFGDLVTPVSWDHLWLSESFAIWFASKVRRVPSSGMTRQRIMAADRMGLAVPVVVSEGEGTELAGLVGDDRRWHGFEKGALILRMLENWLGEDVLRDAIRSYIHTNAGSTVSTESFIEAFRPEVRSDVAKVLRSFATSTGVPTIRSHVSCTEDEPTLLIEQQPYQAPSPRAPGPSLDQRLWTVPVCLRDDSGSRCVVVDRPRIRVGLDRCPRWVHPNAGGSGYYYFQSSLQELLAIIERSAGSLTDAEASAVISNVVALLRSGDISVGEVMEVYVAVSREYPSVGLADVVPRYVGRLVDVTRTQELVQYLRSLPRHADAAHRLADDFDRGRERIMRARDAVKAWVRRREGGPPTRETWGLAGRSNDRELAMEAVRLLNSEQDGVYGALKLLSSVGEPRVLERALKELHPRHLRSVLALALGSPLSWRTALQVMLSSEMVRQSIGDEALFVAAEEWGCDPATARRVAQLGTMTASPRWRIDGVAHTIQECVAVKSRSRRDIDQLLNPYRGAGARRGHELNGNAPDR